MLMLVVAVGALYLWEMKCSALLKFIAARNECLFASHQASMKPATTTLVHLTDIPPPLLIDLLESNPKVEAHKQHDRQQIGTESHKTKL